MGRKLCHSGMLFLYLCCMTELQASSLGDGFVIMDWEMSALSEALEPSRVCARSHEIGPDLRDLCCWVKMSRSIFTLKE